jgi:hypothetical protein
VGDGAIYVGSVIVRKPAPQHESVALTAQP